MTNVPLDLNPLAVFIADSDLRRLIYYEAIIHRMPDMYCVASTPESEKVLDMVQELRPQVVLIDQGLVPITGVSLIEDIQEMAPDIATIFIGGRDASLHQQAKQAGAWYYLQIPVTPKSLVSAIRQVSHVLRD